MKVETAYKLFAPRYDFVRPLWAGGRLGGAELFLERKILPGCCPPGGSVLDLGCGTGANLARALRLGLSLRRYVGLDLSPAMVGRARCKFAGLKNAEFCQGDMHHLPFADGTFDFALSTWALEHVPQVKLAADEALRVLKSGACLALLFHSLPRLPWHILARLSEPIFRVTLRMRFLRPEDYSSLDSSNVWHFAKGLHTLFLLKKER